MRKYRISYDKHFTTLHGEGIPYNNRYIDGLSIYFRYRYYDKNGREILFRIDSQPPCFYRCCYDKETGYRMQLLEDELKRSEYSRVEYEEEDACIWYTDSNEPVIITVEEAKEILIKHREGFDYSNNYPAQNLAYGAKKVG